MVFGRPTQVELGSEKGWHGRVSEASRASETLTDVSRCSGLSGEDTKYTDIERYIKI